MSRSVKMAQETLPKGPLARHGGYSVAHKDELLRRRPEVRRYLKALRRDLLRDLCPEGEEHLTAARRCLLDRMLGKLATARLIESYLAEHGLLRPDRYKEGLLEGHSILALWMTLNAQITKDLLALGLDRKALEVVDLSPMELLEKVGREEEERRAREAEAAAVDDETESGEHEDGAAGE